MIYIDELSPGIKEAVLWFQSKGYETCDSGDGSNYKEGMEGALPYKHIFIEVRPHELITQANTISKLLVEAGAFLTVEATYRPEDIVGIIGIFDDNSTNGFDHLKGKQ